MMEALRILKVVGARPRRTIRIGLWGGEEEGLMGSGLRSRALWRSGDDGTDARAPDAVGVLQLGQRDGTRPRHLAAG